MSTEATKEKILNRMKDVLLATELDVIDESWKHAGHAGAGGGGHFIVHLVSEKFEGVSLLDRNRMVFDALKEEMQAEIHALVIKAKSPGETRK
ncbi:MAG: BolA family protein [Nitrospirota bacterium]|nr:BolA family protein [Nitrospirota bacterium]